MSKRIALIQNRTETADWYRAARRIQECEGNVAIALRVVLGGKVSTLPIWDLPAMCGSIILELPSGEEYETNIGTFAAADLVGIVAA